MRHFEISNCVVLRAACQPMALGPSANGTVPATVICVPAGALTAPVTVDDLDTYNKCVAKLEAARPANCEASMTKFEQATGCGPACKNDFKYYTDRLKTFCSGLPEDNCEFTIAPCQLDTAPMPVSTPGSTPGPAPMPAPGNDNRTVGRVESSRRNESETDVAPRAVEDMGDGGGSSNLGPIIGGVVGGLLVLLLLGLIALVLVRKKQSKRKRLSDAVKESSAELLRSGVKKEASAQKGAPRLWPPPGAYCTNPPQGSPGSHTQLVMHRASGDAWPTSSSIVGTNSAGSSVPQRTVGGRAVTLAQRIKVTCSSDNTFNVTSCGSSGPIERRDSWTSMLNGTSSPAQLLDAQLDFIDQTQRGMLTSTIRCALAASA